MTDTVLLKFFNQNNLKDTTIIPNNNKCVAKGRALYFNSTCSSPRFAIRPLFGLILPVSRLHYVASMKKGGPASPRPPARRGHAKVSLPSREDYDHAMQLNNTLLFEGDATNPVRYHATRCSVCRGRSSFWRASLAGAASWQSRPLPNYFSPSFSPAPLTAAHRHNLARSR